MKNKLSLTLFIFSLLSLFLLNSCDLLNKVFKIDKEVPQNNPLTGQPLGTPATGGVSFYIDQVLALGTLWVDGGDPLITLKKTLLIEGNNLICEGRVNGNAAKNAVEHHQLCGRPFSSYAIKNSTQFTTNGRTYTVTSPTTITGDGTTFTLAPSRTIDQMTHPGGDGLWIDYQNSFPNVPPLGTVAEPLPLHATVLYFKSNYTVCKTEITSPTQDFPSIRSTCPSARLHPYTIDDDTHMTIEGEQYEKTSPITFSKGNHNFFPLAVYYPHH